MGYAILLITVVLIVDHVLNYKKKHIKPNTLNNNESISADKK